MNKFFLGFIAGAATYHFAQDALDKKEIREDLRGLIKTIDEKLAVADAKLAETETVEPAPPGAGPSDPIAERQEL